MAEQKRPQHLEKGPQWLKKAYNELVDYALSVHISQFQVTDCDVDIEQTPSGTTITIKIPPCA